MKSKHGSRRKSREIALCLLYSFEFIKPDNLDSKKEDTLGLVNIKGADEEYAGYLFEGVCSGLEAIDKKIRGFSHHWRLERMNLIDRNIIRIGVFEIFQGQVPIEVIINEAVEISKVFGDSKTSSFVNGILDAIAKELKEDN